MDSSTVKDFYRCSTCPSWYEESKEMGFYIDSKNNQYYICPDCWRKYNIEHCDPPVDLEDKINEQKRLSGEISEEKDFIIDRLKDEKDGFYQENESLKKEIEDLKRKNEILEEEVKRLQDNEISLSDKLDAVLKHNSSFSKRMKKKDNILKIIKGLVYSIANLMEV